MPTLTIIRTDQPDFFSTWQTLRQKLSLEKQLFDDTQRLQRVREIISRVRQDRDEAVVEYTSKFDNVDFRPGQFRVSAEELAAAHSRMDPALLTALRQAIANVRRYQEHIKISTPADINRQGIRLGLRYRPLQRVGVCVPGAAAPLVSTVVMTVVPAQVAGVPQIAVVSCPRYQGTIHPDILGLCRELNISEVYRVSGAQAIAALAFGTEHIPKVDKIVGPGNWWVQLAKKEVFGLVDIDSFAGPSEVLILADESAHPAWIAADMLSQAEHALDSTAILCTDSATIAQRVSEQLDIQLKLLNRQQETRQSIQNCSLAVITRNMDEALELCNEFAPEHLQIQTREPETLLDKVTAAGAIFLGAYSPVATGDYYAGPSHTLPTGSSARFFNPLCVNDFLNHSSIIEYNADALAHAASDITTIARSESLTAHARSVTIRNQSQQAK